MRYNFNKISTKRTLRWTDADGKRHQETREFFQTVNPFNVGKDGVPKSEQEIRAEIHAKADAWIKAGQPTGDSK